MFFNVVVGCTVLAAVVSAFSPQDASLGKVRKDGALYKHVAECMFPELRILDSPMSNSGFVCFV